MSTINFQDGISTVSSPSSMYVDLANGAASFVTRIITDSNNYITILDYNILTENNIPFSTYKLIGEDGMPTSNLHTWSSTQGQNPNYVQILRYFTGVGKQRDLISISTSLNNPNNELYYSVGGNTGTAEYEYIILQQAIPVTKFKNSTDVTEILAPNSSKNISIGELLTLNKEDNRGDEKSSIWKIFKSDPQGSFQSIPAIVGQDYQLVSGTLDSDEIKIKFISNVNFEVHNICEGYDFSSNPFTTEFSYENKTPNLSYSVHRFNLSESIVSYEIKFPKIILSLEIPASALVGTDPIQTYQNQLILISSVFDLTTASWIKKINLQQEILSKSEEEWRQEILNRCNIVLEIREKDTNLLITTKPGLGPHSINIANVGNYVFKFKTQLK